MSFGRLHLPGRRGKMNKLLKAASFCVFAACLVISVVQINNIVKGETDKQA